MSENKIEFDHRGFAVWLRQRQQDADTQPEHEPRVEHVDAARPMWTVVSEGREEAGISSFRPLRLAAADEKGEMPLHFNTGHGELEFMRVAGSSLWRVVFCCEPALREALRGRRPSLQVGAEQVVLSEIDDAGLSRADLPEGVGPADLLSFEIR